MKSPPSFGEGGIRSSCFTCAASLQFISLLKHIRWSIATLPDSVSAERHHRGCHTKGKPCGPLNFSEIIIVSHLGSPAPNSCPEMMMLQMFSTLCRLALSHVSMWWWAERHGWSQRKNKKEKKHTKKKGENPSLKSNINSRTCPERNQ